MAMLVQGGYNRWPCWCKVDITDGRVGAKWISQIAMLVRSACNMDTDINVV